MLWTREAALAAVEKFGWALEQLELETQFGVSVAADDGASYAILDLMVENGAVSNGEIVLSNDLKSSIPSTVFKWVQSGQGTQGAKMDLPVYLNSMRKNLLITLSVSATEEQMVKCAYQRGVALIASS